jgi:DnaK suppressor protein
MAKTPTELYRRILLQKRQDVLSSFESKKMAGLQRAERVAEEDEAQRSHEEFISIHLNSMDYRQLRLIQEALDRIHSGDYGTCLNCEEPIPAKRLEAVPWARYCVKCQEEIGAGSEEESAAPKKWTGDGSPPPGNLS